MMPSFDSKRLLQAPATMLNLSLCLTISACAICRDARPEGIPVPSEFKWKQQEGRARVVALAILFFEGYDKD